MILGLPTTQEVPMHFQRSDSIVGSPAKPFLIGRSRLETEFEELEVLGSGGFGDVIKVGVVRSTCTYKQYYRLGNQAHVPITLSRFSPKLWINKHTYQPPCTVGVHVCIFTCT